VSLKVTFLSSQHANHNKKSGLLFLSNRPRSILFIVFLVQISRLPVGFIQQATTNQSLFGG